MAMAQAVVILGDEVALGQGVEPNKGWGDRLGGALGQHGVEVMNWSKPEQSAVALGSEFEGIQKQLREATMLCEVYVVIALGNHDRAMQMEELLEQYLEAVVKGCQNENGRPVILQAVPMEDGIEERVAKSTGATFVKAPKSCSTQFQQEGGALPFMPQRGQHGDIAKTLVAVLEKEMRLGQGGGADHGASSSRLPSKRGGGSRRGGGGGEVLDGAWAQQDNPEMVNLIQGDVIVTPNGEHIPIVRVSNDALYTELDGQRVEAKVAGGNILLWNDGDVWVKVEEQHGAPALESPPSRRGGGGGGGGGGKKGDLRSLKKMWDAAEEAVNRTRVEEQKRELEKERERLARERERLEEWRRAYEEGRQIQHEETEKVSALRAGG